MIDSLNVVGLSEGVTVREDNTRYMELVRQLHLDKQNSVATGIKSTEAVDMLKIINNTQQLLLSTICRYEYSRYSNRKYITGTKPFMIVMTLIIIY